MIESISGHITDNDDSNLNNDNSHDNNDLSFIQLINNVGFLSNDIADTKQKSWY